MLLFGDLMQEQLRLLLLLPSVGLQDTFSEFCGGAPLSSIDVRDDCAGKAEAHLLDV